MQSPDCSVNHLQPLTIREQAEQEANSKRLLCSQTQMLPRHCSSHITLLSPSLSLLSPRAAPAVILQKTIWVFILVPCCPWPRYSQAWSCQTALQNLSIYITKLLWPAVCLFFCIPNKFRGFLLCIWLFLCLLLTLHCWVAVRGCFFKITVQTVVHEKNKTPCRCV